MSLLKSTSRNSPACSKLMHPMKEWSEPLKENVAESATKAKKRMMRSRISYSTRRSKRKETR